MLKVLSAKAYLQSVWAHFFFDRSLQSQSQVSVKQLHCIIQSPSLLKYICLLIVIHI